MALNSTFGLNKNEPFDYLEKYDIFTEESYVTHRPKLAEFSKENEKTFIELVQERDAASDIQLENGMGKLAEMQTRGATSSNLTEPSVFFKAAAEHSEHPQLYGNGLHPELELPL
jgi:hypothetical protein